jgi:hypothetical protein
VSVAAIANHVFHTLTYELGGAGVVHASEWIGLVAIGVAVAVGVATIIATSVLEGCSAEK